MKIKIFSAGVFLFSSLGLANQGPTSIYECRYEIRDLLDGKMSVYSGHLVDDPGKSELHRQLTLEPISSSAIPVTARAILFRLDKRRNYIPMSLHPRGDTVTNLAYAQLDDERGTTISYRDVDRIYTFTCGNP